MSARDARLIKIQIARRDLGLQDDDYRALLDRVTGKTSSSGLTPSQKDAVLVEMKRLGFTPKPTTNTRRKWTEKEDRADIRYMLVIWRLLAERRVVETGRSALNAFACGPKFHQKYSDAPTDVRFLSVERAQDVIEALKDIARRNQVRLTR